jgi:hypothetical protein
VTGYVYTYALMEPHDLASSMQREMIREVEAGRPRYLVFVNVTTSWLARPTSDRTILRWCKEYCERHYEMVGGAFILSESRTSYRFDENLDAFRPPTPFWVGVYRRKDGS